MKKESIKIFKTCTDCGKKMEIYLYPSRKYRGGHYFGKVPLFHKKDMLKAIKNGTRKWKMGDHVVDVLKKDPKPYGYFEDWECPTCYWHPIGFNIPQKMKRDTKNIKPHITVLPFARRKH